MWQQEPTGDSPLGMSASTAVRFGIVPDQNLPWQTLVERWRLFEELGFDSAWDCDHFIQPSRPTGPYFEAWTLLAGLTAVPPRLPTARPGTSKTFRPSAPPAQQAHDAPHQPQHRPHPDLV